MWYDDKKNLMELAEFLVESDELTTARELFEYFKHPEKYTEVWKTYQEEVMGKSYKSPICIFREVPRLVAIVNPSAQCA